MSKGIRQRARLVPNREPLSEPMKGMLKRELVKAAGEVVEAHTELERAQIALANAVLERDSHTPTTVYTALEKLLEVINWYNPSNRANVLFTAGDMNNDYNAAVKAHTWVSLGAKSAEPYFVSTEIKRVILDAMDTLPLDSIYTEDLFPTEYGFVWLETPLVQELTVRGIRMDINCFLWERAHYKDGWAYRICGFSPIPLKNAPMIHSVFSFEIGSTLQDAFDHYVIDMGLDEAANANFSERVGEQIRFFTAFLHFVNSRYSGAERHRADRATGRRWSKQEGTEAPLIKIVTLRARETRRRNRTTAGEGHPISVRYIRRQHFHNYWCGGKSSECLHPGHTESALETRFIPATLCGPEGAPLKEAAKLFAVTR